MTAVIKSLPKDQSKLLCIGDGVDGCKLIATHEAVGDSGETVPCCINRDCQGLAYQNAIKNPQT